MGSLKEAKSVAVGCAGFVLYLMQPFLADRTTLVFSCLKLGPEEDDWFLTNDLSVRCWTSPEHWRLLTLGIPMMIVYDPKSHFF